MRQIKETEFNVYQTAIQYITATENNTVTQLMVHDLFSFQKKQASALTNYISLNTRDAINASSNDESFVLHSFTFSHISY